MKILKNKKGDERYLFIWMILNWLIIGIAIMIGVSIFYSAQADSRMTEASILSSKVLNCLSNDFSLAEISSDNFDISSKCGFNKQAVEKSDLYYIEIKINSNEKNIKTLKFGNTAYSVLCGQISNEQSNNFPKCITKTFEVQDSISKIKYTLSVLAASNQI